MSQKRGPNRVTHFIWGQKRMRQRCEGANIIRIGTALFWRKSRIRDNSVEKQTEHVRQQYISLDRPLCYLAAIINGLGIFISTGTEIGPIQFKPYFICFAAGVPAGTPLLLASQALRRISYAGFTHYSVSLFMFFSNGLIKRSPTTEDARIWHRSRRRDIAIYGVSDRIGSQIS